MTGSIIITEAESSKGKRRLSMRTSPEKKARGNSSDKTTPSPSSKGNLKTKRRMSRDPEQRSKQSSLPLPLSSNARDGVDQPHQPSSTCHSSRSSSPSATSESDRQLSTAESLSTSRSLKLGQSANTPSSTSSFNQRHLHPTSISMPPKWRTTSTEPEAQSIPNASITSSRSSGRNPHLSISAPSRLPSPPPSFNLSSGQPLVNPPLKTQAAFVGKLFAMLEDEEIKSTGLIYWSSDGSIFTCPNPTEFSKVVLPRFFKHNNWQSFVRQLNMYSFSKVNDLFATTTDPGAWEFRHPLFRRGEPQLLASIKRKTTRPNHTEDGRPLPSPTEEFDAPKAIAGWMRESQTQGHPGQNTGPLGRANSPLSREARSYWDGGDPNTPRASDGERRPNSQGYLWENTQNTSRMPPPDSTSQSRPHSDSYRAPPPPHSATHRYGPTVPDSPFYPQPQHSPVDALSGQIATLEERVHRLSETLTNERVENVRNNLDFTSYLLSLTGWIGEGKPPPSPNLRSLQETLSRASADLRQRYESLVAEYSAIDRRSRTGFDQAPFGPYHSFRGHTPHSDVRVNHAIPNPTPRQSPLTAQFPESGNRHLPPFASGGNGGAALGAIDNYQPPPPHSSQGYTHSPATPVHAHGHGHTHFLLPLPSGQPGNGNGNVQPSGPRGFFPADTREKEKEKDTMDSSGGGGDESMDDVKPVKGLSSLLN